MKDQKAENLLNLALSVPEEERRQTGELDVGYDRETRTWELIVKYSGDLAGAVREQFPEAELKELSGGCGILTVPEEEVPGILGLKEIEYAEKPKRLFFAINQAKAASCLTLVQQGPEGLTGRGVLVGILDSGIDYFHGDFRHEDGTSRILFLNDQVTGNVYTKDEIDEALGTGSREAARALVPSADPGGHGAAVAGIAARKKDGETVSGDAGTYFKRGDGTLYVLLCDGMGSGPQANRESSLALRLLEQFLQAGVETEHALVTLNSALALRGEEAGGFTTVDLLQVDLFTGDGVVFKLGAAPTYVRKGGTVRRISGTSLPAGLEAEERSAPDRFPIHLSPGDCVVLVSDGVTGTEDDSWLRERLVKFDQGSPKELARDLITHSPQGATDDSTALVIRLEKRE